MSLRYNTWVPGEAFGKELPGEWVENQERVTSRKPRESSQGGLSGQQVNRAQLQRDQETEH